MAEIITSGVSHLPELGPTVAEGLFAALQSAGNYIDAGAAAERIATLGFLSEEQFIRLDEIFWQNDQVNGGAPPPRALRPLYLQNGRVWPPPAKDQDGRSQSLPHSSWAIMNLLLEGVFLVARVP